MRQIIAAGLETKVSPCLDLAPKDQVAKRLGQKMAAVHEVQPPEVGESGRQVEASGIGLTSRQ
jgi:hypothetical protein